MITLTVAGLPPGDWAEWFGAGAAALAFGATSVAIWLGHHLRVKEHDEAMFDEALKVTTVVTQGSEYVDVGTMEVPERKAVPKITVTVYNDGRRPITNVWVYVTPLIGTLLGESGVEFIQAGQSYPFQFDPIDEVYAPFGSNPSINAVVMLSFEDISGTMWKRGPPSDRLLLFPKERWWRSKPGRRHQARPRSPG